MSQWFILFFNFYIRMGADYHTIASADKEICVKRKVFQREGRAVWMGQFSSAPQLFEI